MCLNITNRQYENIGNINEEITKYNEFKNKLFDKLNNDLLLAFPKLKEIASDIYRENQYDFELKVHSLKNIFFSWNNNSFIFKKY